MKVFLYFHETRLRNVMNRRRLATLSGEISAWSFIQHHLTSTLTWYTRRSKKMTNKKIPNKKWVLWGQVFPKHDCLVLFSLSKKRPKNIFPDTGGPGHTGHLACALLFQQDSISHFFRHLVYYVYIINYLISYVLAIVFVGFPYKLNY